MLPEVVKEAAWFGLAVGVIAMAAYLLYVYGKYLVPPTVAIAAAAAEIPKPKFGFGPE